MSIDNLLIKRKFNLSKQRLFEAWSNPQLMQRWFYASQLRENCCTVENQFVTGGKYKIIMHFDESGDIEIGGEYLEIDRYSKIVFTWANGLVSNTVVTLGFKALSPNTAELVLEHALFPDEEARRQHNQGWDQCLINLAIALEQVA